MDEKPKLLGNFEKILKFFDENSIEKLNFLFFYFFENLLLKIELSEITPFFYNNFFGFGGDFPPSPPGYALGKSYIFFRDLSIEFHLKISKITEVGEFPIVLCKKEDQSYSVLMLWMKHANYHLSSIFRLLFWLCWADSQIYFELRPNLWEGEFNSKFTN